MPHGRVVEVGQESTHARAVVLGLGEAHVVVGGGREGVDALDGATRDNVGGRGARVGGAGDEDGGVGVGSGSGSWVGSTPVIKCRFLFSLYSTVFGIN